MSDSNAVLRHANAEWQKRPADESYASLAELHAAVTARTEIAREARGVKYADLRTTAESGDVQLVGKQNRPASFTHWSFGQLCRALAAPADFLRRLPATLASNVLNNQLSVRGEDAGTCKLLLEQNGHSKVRAFTGDGYARIWDKDITERLIRLEAEDGWRPAPETALPGGGVTRGLYASDHDVFAFLVDNDRRVFEKAPGGGLSRGMIVGNSEVGDSSFWMLKFLYAYVCANHNIWGVDQVQELRIRHQGRASERAFGEFEVELKKYQEASAAEDEAKIQRCIASQLGKDKKEVLDLVFGLKLPGLTKTLLAEAWDAAEQHEGWYLAPPTSAWGFGNGITEVARGIEHADRRVEVERSAGKVMEVSF